MDLTEADDIKKRWQEYTEELYKKELHDSNSQAFCQNILGSSYEYHLFISSPTFKWGYFSFSSGIFDALLKYSACEFGYLLPFMPSTFNFMCFC